MKTFYRVVLILVFMGILGLVSIVGYGVYVISDLKKLNTFTLESPEKLLPFKKELYIESGSFINITDWQRLFAFLEFGKDIEEESFGEWKKELVNKGYLSKISDLTNESFLVNKKLFFHLYKINHCDRPYCYQRKMNFGEVPPSLWRGLIGIEDSRFLSHEGIDLIALFRALAADLKAMSFVQGGSTLTQQLVKNLYFSNEKTISRKFKEILLSIYIESRYSKEEILQTYFNEVVWGSIAGVRIKGAYAASIFYFNKKPEQLTSFEGAILSGMLKGPYYYHPLKNLDKLKSRANLVYKKLRNDNFISSSDDSFWSESNWKKWVDNLKERNSDLRYKALVQGLKESTFLDSYLMGVSSLEVLKKYEDKNLDLAVKFISKDVSVDCKKECTLNSYYSKLERDKFLAINEEKTQVGSILKPFGFQLLFNNNIEKSELYETKKITLNLKSGKWTPKESTKKDLPEFVSLEFALQRSMNIPFIRALNDFGFLNLEKGFKYFLPNLKTPFAQYPSQALGSLEMSSTDVMNSYESLIKSICSQIQSSEIELEDTVLGILSDPKVTTIRYSVSKLLSSFKFFGKTGTSNHGNDNWFIGFDGRYLTAIWLGIESNRSTKSTGLSGSKTAYRVYDAYKRRSGRFFENLSCQALVKAEEI